MAPQEELVVEETLVLELRGQHLPKASLLGSPDAFFQLRRSVEGISEESWPMVATSSVVHHSRDPSWARLSISVKDLCNNDPQRTLLLEILDRGRHKDTLLGATQCCLESLLAPHASFTLRNEGNKNAELARIHVVSASVSRVERVQPSPLRAQLSELRARLQQQFSKIGAYPMLWNPFSLVNYMQAGLRIKLSFAIDFTGSNGHPLDPGSLHEKKADNPYASAIRAIGEIVKPYAVPEIAAHGFGGSLGNYTGAEVSHCFSLNLDKETFSSVDEVIEVILSVF